MTNDKKPPSDAVPIIFLLPDFLFVILEEIIIPGWLIPEKNKEIKVDLGNR